MQDSGTAIRNAAAQVREILVAEAAQRLGVPPAELHAEGKAVVGPGGRSVGYGELVDRPGAARRGRAAIAAEAARQLPGHGQVAAARRHSGQGHGRRGLRAGPAARGHGARPRRPAAEPGRQPRRASTRAAVGSDAGRGRASSATAASSRSSPSASTRRCPRCARSPAAPTWDEERDAARPDRPSGLSAKAPRARSAPSPRAGRRRSAAGATVARGDLHPALPDARLDRPLLRGRACWNDEGLTVWSHTQGVYPDREAIAEMLGMPLERVRVIHMEGSGCYGHNGADDAAADAALIASALPGRPVRVQWMREQEHAWEPYGPAMLMKVARLARRPTGVIADWSYDLWSNDALDAARRRRVADRGAASRAAVRRRARRSSASARRQRRPQREPALHVPQQAGALALRAGDAAAGLGAARARRLRQRLRDRELHGRAGARGGDRSGRVPAAPSRRPARARRGGDARAEQFGWSQDADGAGRGRGFAFARYKNLAAYCAVAVEVEVERETGRVRVRPRGRGDRQRRGGQSRRHPQPDRGRHHPVDQLDALRGGDLRPTRGSPASTGRAIRSCASRSVPDSVEVHVIDRPGAPFLGTGEAAQGPAAAAVANAVRNATGKRLHDLPFTRQRVKQAIGA